DEASPLLSSASSSHEQHGFLAPGRPRAADRDEFQSTKSIWYLILLTISIGGLQIAWSVEMSNGSPYLLSLGLSKSLMALVWIAGPLTGTLVQPYVGMLSDRCRISWGKRKPFMLGGAVATMASLMILAWSKDIVGGFLSLFGADPASQGVKVTVIVFAVLWVYILDFSINTVQAAIRAFIVDCAPAHQQEAANAMASRITGVGNIVGYIAGYLDLPKIMWWLGDSQFKCLCAIASVALGCTVLLSMVIKERDPRLEGPKQASRQPGVFSFFIKLFTSIKRLPPQTKKVCIVQFCAWIGFFPMLFYTSSYIGEIYVQPYLEENPHMTPEEVDQLYEKATRVGTFALLIFAITSLTTNVFLPFFIAPTYDSQPVGEAPGEGPSTSLHTYGGENNSKSWTDRLIIPGLTLRRAWMFSQLLFMVSMLCTVIVRTVPAATVLVGLVGITWALTLWAPFAIISAEISRRDALARQRKQASSSTTGPAAGPSSSSSIPASAAGPSRFDGYTSDQDHKLDDDDDEHETDQAGVILGIHNMAIAAPQIIATVGSSLIFKIFQKPRGTPGDHSIAIVMAIGGVTVGASAWFIHLIRDEAEEGPSYSAVDTMEAGEGEQQQQAGATLRQSMEGLATTASAGTKSFSRRSLDRATLVRNKSSSGLD
ncbi:MFS general substrate transporter, partial [Cryphonectria parasitica EP155]